MSAIRNCGAACHQARRLTCNCWCKGLFHGPRGRKAREAFYRVTGTYPGVEGDCDDFEDGIIAARHAVGEFA